MAVNHSLNTHVSLAMEGCLSLGLCGLCTSAGHFANHFHPQTTFHPVSDLISMYVINMFDSLRLHWWLICTRDLAHNTKCKSPLLCMMFGGFFVSHMVLKIFYRCSFLFLTFSREKMSVSRSYKMCIKNLWFSSHSPWSGRKFDLLCFCWLWFNNKKRHLRKSW